MRERRREKRRKWNGIDVMGGVRKGKGRKQGEGNRREKRGALSLF